MNETSDTAQRPAQPVVATGPLLGRLCELLEAVRKLQTDAQVYGLAGATNAPSVRCEVKGLTLGHFYEIEKAMDALVGPNVAGEARASKNSQHEKAR